MSHSSGYVSVSVSVLAVAVLFVSACGAQQSGVAPVTSAAPTAQAAQTVPTLAPSPTTVLVEPTATTASLESQPIVAPSLPSPTIPTPTLPLYNGIPHGVTADGFYFLGSPDAPVTLTDYSDFL